MRYQEIPLTPELDELQQAGLVWYRCRDWDEGQYDFDGGGNTPSYWEKLNPGMYSYAIRIED